MHYEQFYNVKFKWLKRGYINYCFMSFSDLELSFWFKLVLKLFFVRRSLKVPLLILLNFIGMLTGPGFHGNQKSDFDLPHGTRYHGNHMSDFQRNSLFV